MSLTFYNNKAIRNADRLAAYLADKPVVPVTLDIDLTNKCNCKCPHCTGGRDRKTETAKFGDILRLMAQFKNMGGRSVVFTGGGEPTLHPDLPTFLHRAGNDIDLKTALVTNGIFLDNHPELVDAIVNNCTWIRISLDAGTPKLYMATHGTNSFDAVLSGISKLVKGRRRLNRFVGDCAEGPSISIKPAPTPTIGVAFLTGPETIGDMEQACIKVKETGADYIYFRPFLGDRTVVDIDALKAKFDDAGFEVIGASAYQRFGGNGRGYDKCGFGWWVCVVKANGIVTWCCQHREDKRYWLGDIRNERFEDILERRKSISVDLQDCPSLCRGDEMNRFLHQAAKPVMHEEFL